MLNKILLTIVSILVFGHALPNDQSSLKDTIKKYLDVEHCLKEVQGQPNICKEDVQKQSKVINDSLVKNLACESLTLDNVFTNLQPDAFDLNRHWPLINWDATGIQQCWALAFSQRRLFYLARFNANENGDLPKDEVLDLISSSNPKTIIPIPRAEIFDIKNILEKGLSGKAPLSFQVLSKYETIPNSVLDGAHFLYKMILEFKLDQQKSMFLKTDATDENEINFKKSIEDLQRKLFFRIGNISLLTGQAITSVETNKGTISKILSNLKQGRLPLIVVREKITAQHVVLIKSAEKIGEDEFKLRCYDSNFPFKEVIIYYRDGKFSAVEAMFKETESEVGVFIKDEEDMDHIQKVAYKYYKKMCDEME